MFYLIGLGLGGVEDITVKGLRIVKQSKRVYLEAYTSILTIGASELEKFYGIKLIIADRKMVEEKSDEILKDADVDDIAFLVVGDPFGATTHMDLMLRARELGIKTSCIHNASIINAVGCTGLQLYRFGELVSIVFWDEVSRPTSYVEKIIMNLERGSHTLCLLDIKMKEQTIENLIKGKEIYEPPRFMSVSQAATQLLQIIKSDFKNQTYLTEDTMCLALARVGTESQTICKCTLKNMVDAELGPPLHSIVIIGDLHAVEKEALDFTVDNLR